MKNHIEATQYKEMLAGFDGMLDKSPSAGDVARAHIYYRFMQQSAHYLGGNRGKAGRLSLNFDG